MKKKLNFSLWTWLYCDPVFSHRGTVTRSLAAIPPLDTGCPSSGSRHSATSLGSLRPGSISSALFLTPIPDVCSVSCLTSVRTQPAPSCCWCGVTPRPSGRDCSASLLPTLHHPLVCLDKCSVHVLDCEDSEAVYGIAHHLIISLCNNKLSKHEEGKTLSSQTEEQIYLDLAQS